MRENVKMKRYLLDVQKDILESKGVFRFYLVVFVLFCVIGTPQYPILNYLPRLVTAIIGLLHLLPIYVLFKSERDKKQNREICFYILLLSVFAVAIINRMV